MCLRFCCISQIAIRFRVRVDGRVWVVSKFRANALINSFRDQFEGWWEWQSGFAFTVKSCQCCREFSDLCKVFSITHVRKKNRLNLEIVVKVFKSYGNDLKSMTASCGSFSTKKASKSFFCKLSWNLQQKNRCHKNSSLLPSSGPICPSNYSQFHANKRSTIQTW